MRMRFRAIAPLALAILLVGLWACGGEGSASSGGGGSVMNPAWITDDSRQVGLADDYLRVLWVTHGTTVDHIGRVDHNFRAFFSATRFFQPPSTVNDYLNWAGNYYDSQRDLVMLRCRPDGGQKVALAPILATWPNVFAAIAADLSGYGFSCPAPEGSGDNELYCTALKYSDDQQVIYVNGLYSMFDIARDIFSSDTAAAAIKNRYGIYKAFTGLGFTVKDSTNDAPLLGAQVLQQSVIPEYLLMNLSLADGGCTCVQVAAYEGRQSALLNPDFISSHGTLDNGACRQVS